MSTIVLTATSINQVSDKLIATRGKVDEFRKDLLSLRSSMMDVDSSICDLGDVMEAVKSSCDAQSLKSSALGKVEKDVDDFIDFAGRTDSSAADYINRAKADFYKKYSWLKPDGTNGLIKWAAEKFGQAKEFCKSMHEKTKIFFEVTVLGKITAIIAKLEQVFGYLKGKAEPVLAPFIQFAKDIREDIANFNWQNTDEETVLRSNYISAYKGKFVIRHNVEGQTSCSFGILFINSNDSATNPIYWADADTIKHEYGHTVQFDQLGLIRYLIYIAGPSVNAYNNGTNGVYYYDQLWERAADYYGGLDRGNYSPDSLAESLEYSKAPELYVLKRKLAKAEETWKNFWREINKSLGGFQWKINSTVNP